MKIWKDNEEIWKYKLLIMYSVENWKENDWECV